MKDVKGAEQSVIGCILINAPETMPLALQELEPEDFTLAECRTVYEACRKLFLDRKPIDPLTVLDATGGGPEQRVFLVRLVEAVIDPHNFGIYLQIVAENARRLRAAAKVTELQSALLGNENLDGCRALAAEATGILNRERDGSTVQPKDGYYQVYLSLQKTKEYLHTGFEALDRFAYIDRGDYVVIGGRPSSGKTALTLQIMYHIAKRRKVLYFSLETSAKKLYDRLVSLHTGIPFQKIKSGNIPSGPPMEAVAAGYDSFQNLNFAVVEAAGWTVEKIAAKAIQENAEVIFIDYLSLISSQGKNMVERVTQISIGLHTLAQTSNIAVFALSQLNRDGKNDPDMTALRESGQVEQDADLIMLLVCRDPDMKDSERILKIVKNKEGATGDIRLAFEGDCQRFKVIDSR